MWARVLKLVGLAFVLTLGTYFAAFRDRVIVAVHADDGLPADVIVSLVAVYGDGNKTHADAARTRVVRTGSRATFRLARRFPWSFRHLQVSAGHPRYRPSQEFHARNPHWHSRRIDIELTSWAATPGGRVVARIDNLEEEAAEHLAWLHDDYVTKVDALTAAGELAKNMPLLRAIAFEGRRLSPEQGYPGEQIANSLAALEAMLAQQQSQPCPNGYVRREGAPLVCGTKQVEVIWP